MRLGTQTCHISSPGKLVWWFPLRRETNHRCFNAEMRIDGYRPDGTPIVKIEQVEQQGPLPFDEERWVTTEWVWKLWVMERKVRQQARVNA